MITDGSLFAFGGAVTFTALAGSYVYLRGAFRRRARNRHAGLQQARANPSHAMAPSRGRG